MPQQTLRIGSETQALRVRKFRHHSDRCPTTSWPTAPASPRPRRGAIVAGPATLAVPDVLPVRRPGHCIEVGQHPAVTARGRDNPILPRRQTPLPLTCRDRAFSAGIVHWVCPWGADMADARAQGRNSDGIFICYRRGVTDGLAGRLRDRLCDRFPPSERVFMDVDIAPAAAWGQVIEDAICSSGVMLVLIGTDWMQSQQPERQPGNVRGGDSSWLAKSRLDDPE